MKRGSDSLVEKNNIYWEKIFAEYDMQYKKFKRARRNTAKLAAATRCRAPMRASLNRSSFQQRLPLPNVRGGPASQLNARRNTNVDLARKHTYTDYSKYLNKSPRKSQNKIKNRSIQRLQAPRTNNQRGRGSNRPRGRASHPRQYRNQNANRNSMRQGYQSQRQNRHGQHSHSRHNRQGYVARGNPNRGGLIRQPVKKKVVYIETGVGFRTNPYL